MGFLHLTLLPFVALAAIPIVLHLLTLHRLKTVELSTFRFLFDSYVQQRRRMRFLEALLAGLRALAVLLLVLLVMRPVVRHWGGLFGSGSGRDVVLLVDGSASMNARTAGVPAMERAKAAALAVAKRMGRDDRLTLIRVGAKPEEIFGRFAVDAAAVREKIESLQVGPSRANIFAALSMAFDPKVRKTPPTVYLFTDGQAGGWREVRDQGLAKVIPEKAKLFVVDVGSKEPIPNRGIIGDVPRPSQAIVGLPVTLRPRVVNHSKSDAAEVAVGVILDEKEVARASLSLKPGETASKEVIYVPSEPGVMRGRYEIAADRFPDDDSYLFTLSVAPPVKVLLVNGNPASDPFENEGLYLRTALTTDAEGEGQGDAPAKSPGRDTLKALDLREIPEAALNPDLLQDASVAILANCGALNDQHFAWLREYVSAGGGLIVCPGDRVNPDTYNTHFFNAPGPAPLRFVGATLGPPEGEPEKAETFERLATIDYAHPILSVFDDPNARYLTGARIYRRFGMTLPPAREKGGDKSKAKGNATWPLVKFGKGTPALIESRFGDGLVLVTAFPANPKWSNLPLKPEFVPLVLRMVGHVRRGAELSTPSTVAPGLPAEIVLDGSWAPALGRVTDAKGRATPIEFERSATRLVGEFDKTAEKGYYAVDVKGGRAEQPKAGTAAFAVDLAPEESDFALAKESQLREWLPTADLAMFDATAEAQQLHGGLGEEREIWRPLIYLLFAIIGVEFLLATMSGRRAPGDADEAPTVSERIRGLSPGRWAARMTGAGSMRPE